MSEKLKNYEFIEKFKNIGLTDFYNENTNWFIVPKNDNNRILLGQNNNLANLISLATWHNDKDPRWEFQSATRKLNNDEFNTKLTELGFTGFFHENGRWFIVPASRHNVQLMKINNNLNNLIDAATRFNDKPKHFTDINYRWEFATTN